MEDRCCLTPNLNSLNNTITNNQKQKTMEILFKLVSSAEAYADSYGYHVHFFEESGGFTTAFIIAIVVAAVCAAIFYFGLCMSHKTIKMASLPVWCLFLVLSLGATYIVTDQVVIGTDSEDAEASASNFYGDMEDYYLEIQQGAPQTEQEAMNQEKNDIIENLNQGEDVGLMLGLNTIIWNLVFFLFISIIIKGFTTNGGHVPCLWPHGRK